MANPIIYDGTPGPISGSTPFGYYDSDLQFQADGPRVANYCARKLGYPVLDVELDDLNIYACFEEATLEYNRVINEFNIVNNLVSLQGLPQNKYDNLTGLAMKSTGLPYVVQLSKQYGAEALVGGEYEVKRNYINVTGSAAPANTNQVYDLNVLIGQDIEHLTSSRIEVKLS